MNTTENNKIIAEFMGFKTYPIKGKSDGYVVKLKQGAIPFECCSSSLMFHYSWDWLLPVYRKILDYLQEIERPSKNHCCKGDMIEVDASCALMEINIEKVHEHIVELINWYNETNK